MSDAHVLLHDLWAEGFDMLDDWDDGMRSCRWQCAGFNDSRLIQYAPSDRPDHSIERRYEHSPECMWRRVKEYVHEHCRTCTLGPDSGVHALTADQCEEQMAFGCQAPGEHHEFVVGGTDGTA